ncbi:hypothetical protein CEUSTIGMA_g13838.t1, partial [Chlamydomonas eustigma]
MALFGCFFGASSSPEARPSIKGNGVAEENLQRAVGPHTSSDSGDNAINGTRKLFAWGSGTEALHRGNATTKASHGNKVIPADDTFIDYSHASPPGYLDTRLDDIGETQNSDGDLRIRQIGTFDETLPRPLSGAQGETSNVMLSGAELIARGFSTHRAESLSMTSDPASASSSLPITFMVLDIIRSNLRQRQREQTDDEGLEEGGGGHSRKFRNRLVPIFTNKQCRSYFKISTNRDYVELVTPRVSHMSPPTPQATHPPSLACASHHACGS